MHELGARLQRALGDRYRIERELGCGGMGIVFLAADQKLGRPVAVKVMRPEIAQSVGDERFLREIRISSQLSHPHILSLIDSGATEGLLYYVMFYTPGETLRSRLKRESQLPLDEAIRIVQQVADALDHAHRHGVIHRDVKPENILLEEGHALVCDFGLARAVEEAVGERLTHTGVALGTPHYMSPEQAAGEADLDHRTDVYALGCLMYEMVVGTPPFDAGSPLAVLARKMAEPAPRLRGVRAGVPAHVERAVGKALARAPDDRFESAGAFAEALRNPGTSVRIPLRERWTPKLRRAAVAAGVLVAGAGGAAVLLTGRGGSSPLQVHSTQLTSLPGLEDSPRISPDGQWMVYAGDDGNERDVYLRSLTGDRAINLTDDSPADDYAPAFSPDGTEIAFRSERDGGGLYVMGLTGETVRRVSERGESPAWSPDGRRLAYALEYVGTMPLNVEPARSGLWTIDLETGQERVLLETDAVLPSWSPDGRWIAFTVRSSDTRASIWLVPEGGGTPLRLTDDWGGSWSPDGRFVYFTSNRAGSWSLWRIAVDRNAGRALGDAEAGATPSTFAIHPSVSTDGTRILYTNVLTTQNIERAALDPDADTLLEPFPLTAGTRHWSSPDPSPDGTLVAFYSLHLPEGDLYLVRRDGTGLRQLTGDSALDRVPRWSPDGSRIAYWSNRSGVVNPWVINVEGSGNRQLLRGSGASLTAWSSDGRRVAVNVSRARDAPFLLDLEAEPGEQAQEHLARDTSGGASS